MNFSEKLFLHRMSFPLFSSVLTISVFTLMSIFGSVLSDPKIGKYKAINTPLCGYNMHTADEKLCLDWNDDYIPGESNTRKRRSVEDHVVARISQMPWMFLLEIKFYE